MPQVDFKDGSITVPGTTNTAALIVANTTVTNQVSALASKSSGVAGATINAAGSAITNAALLTADFNEVNGADGTKGIQIPVLAFGQSCDVKNNSASTLKVYPQVNGAINLLSANTAFNMATNTACVFKGGSAAGQAWSVPLVAS